MMKHRRLISLLLVVMLVFGMVPTVFATEATEAVTEPTTAATTETTAPETTEATVPETTEETVPETTEATVPETTEETVPETTEATVPETTEETVPETTTAEVCEYCGVELTEDAVHEEDCLTNCTCEDFNGAHQEDCALYVEKSEEIEKLTTVDGVNIQVAGNIPENVNLTAEALEVQQRATFNLRRNSPTLLFAYDITLTDANGNEWQPEDGETVTVSLEVLTRGLADGNKITIVHEHGDDVIELGEHVVTDGKLTFETDGFSTFYFYITYEFGGYSYTMSGNGEVYLSELLDALNIGYSVREVSKVEFSNPEYIEITKEGNDWLLTSLKSFGSVETLTITFDDGEVYEITVKDPVIYNYAVGNSITNVAKLATKTHTVQSVDAGDEAAEGQTYTVNSAQITVDNVKTAGVAEKTAGVHPAPDTVHMIVYATEGMAIDFIGGTDWNYEGSKPTKNGNDIWFWSWESSVKANYVIVKDGSAGKQTKFTVTTTVDGKKYYCNVLLCVVENAKPVLLEDALKSSGLSGMTIKNVPVTLYNYDGKKWNEHYNTNSGNYFAFSGTVKGVVSTENAGNRGWTTAGVQANGGGSVALMGIMQDRLVNGLPVTSQGQKVDLFSTNAFLGKTVYPNVGFQFVYNEKTGYYTYNSALNHAQYNADKNEIQLYKQSLAPCDTPNNTSHGNAGFYPFEDINNTYTNTGYQAIDWTTWQNKLEKNAFELIPAEYSTDMVGTSSTNPASTVELHYGIQVNSDFYLPQGKKLNGQEMIYEFTGDDDLWVYIDGKLVLDIGGGHTYVSGSFNLTTGDVWVEKYTQLAAADGGSYSTRVQGTDLKYKDNFLIGLAEDQMHTIQIFYLERHGGVSNCRMRFNLPLVPANSVHVSKSLANQDGKTEFALKPDLSYTFQLMTARNESEDWGKNDDVDAPEGSFVALKNAPYTVTGTDAPAGTQYTDATTGNFTLKHGWTASFEGIQRFTEVYAVEIDPNDGFVYTSSKVTVDDQINTAAVKDYKFGDKADTKVMQLDKSISYRFNNYIQTKDIEISKNVIDEDGAIAKAAQTDSNVTTDYAFNITINDLAYTNIATKYTKDAETGTATTIGDNGTFTLADGEKIIIPDVPVNYSYTVKESTPTAPSGYSYDIPKFNNVECKYDTGYTYQLAEINKVVVQNILKPMFGDLIITKTGIDELDNHSYQSEQKKLEQQSTIYEISGTSASGEKISLEVVIVGNNSVTIKGIPVGTAYTVKEKMDWAWRYGNNDAERTNVEVKASTPTKLTFTNTREDIYWLSGDSYAENRWDEAGTSVNRTNINDKAFIHDSN